MLQKKEKLVYFIRREGERETYCLNPEPTSFFFIRLELLYAEDCVSQYNFIPR